MTITAFPADRLLLQRLRKSQSGTALYGDTAPTAEDVQEPSVHLPFNHHNFNHRLIVVANRLPVIASKDNEGNWSLQARPHTSDTVLFAAQTFAHLALRTAPHLSYEALDFALLSCSSCLSISRLAEQAILIISDN